MIALAELNRLPPPEFIAFLSEIFEHSPWVAAGAAEGRPYPSIEALHAAMTAVVEAAPSSAKLALLRAHPELAAGGPLTSASAAEQGGKGLDRLGGEQASDLARLNLDYRTRFGFPFIIAVRGQRDINMILDKLTHRLNNSTETELSLALAEVAKIARFRLDDRVNAN